MSRMLVMTMIGQDRPGLVESVAGLVKDHGGNWLESRMSRLGGQFAGILRVAVPEARQEPLTAALQSLATKGLKIVVQPDLPPPSPTPARETTIELVGQDRPGIVQQISRALADNGVNVEELETECASAAMSGETLFKASARVSIPPACNIPVLRRQLEQIAADLIVEISFADLETPQTP